MPPASCSAADWGTAMGRVVVEPVDPPVSPDGDVVPAEPSDAPPSPVVELGEPLLPPLVDPALPEGEPAPSSPRESSNGI